jgi:hypothetical protein
LPENSFIARSKPSLKAERCVPPSFVYCR